MAYDKLYQDMTVEQILRNLFEGGAGQNITLDNLNMTLEELVLILALDEPNLNITLEEFVMSMSLEELDVSISLD